MNRFEQELLESPSLPRLPAQARLLLELVAAGESGAAVEVLEEDAGLTARVLALVEGKRHDSVRPDRLEEARDQVGAHALACSALGLSLVGGLHDALGHTELLDSLFRSSLMTGLAARSLSFEVSSWDPGEALLAGMVEKVGAVLLYDQVPEYPRLVARYLSGEAELAEIERERFGSDHRVIASRVLEHWGMPASVCDALRAHFAVDRAGIREPAMSRGRILTGAALFGQALSIDGFLHEVGTLERRVAELARIPASLVGRIATELPWQLRRIGPAVGVDCDRQAPYEELLADAGQLLPDDAPESEGVDPIPLSGAQRGNSSREFENLLREGESSLSLDSRTGRFDLEGFERMLSAFLDRARQLERPLSVLVIGVRDLRGITERLGEAVAEELVADISDRVANLVRRSDPKGDLSDAHLGVIAAGCSERDLPRLAERIRWAITREPLTTRSGPVPCELSIGMATTSPRTAATDPQALMSSAWSALDEAVLSGGPIAVGA
jgi:diguanylate cyclase (GGDEF)-like protein